MTIIAQNLPDRLTACAGVLPLDAAREAAFRAALLVEARSWIGTPYRQLGAAKGVAVDCSMLLVCCIVNIGLVEPFDPRPYPPAWFLHQGDERYIDWLNVVALEVETPQPGDFVTFRIGRAFAHSGIVSGDEQLVHAFADEGMVRESTMRTPALSYQRGNRAEQSKLRPRRYFDLFARLRLNSESR